MTGIDYEKEYDNRGRVPDHPVIFARWDKDAVAYRDELARAGRAELGVSYGPSARQIVDIFKPASDSGMVALFIHGGYWRALHPSSFSHIARGLVDRGVTVGVAGYDLAPTVGIATIIDQMRAACLLMWNRTRKRMMVYGHSAGGHLAASMLATDWKKYDASAPADLVPAAYSVSGVFDLTPLVRLANNADFKLDESSAKAVSPAFWPAPGGILDSIVGGDESSEFLRQAKIITDAWKGRTQTRYEAVPGTNHFTVLDPLSDPNSAMSERTFALCQMAQGVK